MKDDGLILHSSCSFCGLKPQKDRILIASQVKESSVTICSQCIAICQTILSTGSDKTQKFELELDGLPKPPQIKKHLDLFVIAQDDSKIMLSVAVYNHYKRLLHKAKNVSNVEIDKSNVLFLGPTGTGKTLLARAIARLLKVPFTIADATTLTEAGYVGDDVENIVVSLLQAANYDVANTERGIIYIDEFDKIAKTAGANPSITRDVSGEGVQQALLKILEGTICSVPPQGGRKHPDQPLVNVNTRDILFICGGSFQGLEMIIEQRRKTSSMGFSSTPKERKKSRSISQNVFSFVEPEDLVQFGIIPELVGRIPAITTLHHLNEKHLLQILTEPKNSLIRQYQELFSLDGIELIFEKVSLENIVTKTMQKKMGARGLRSILEKILTPIMFQIFSKKKLTKCIITSDTIIDSSNVILS